MSQRPGLGRVTAAALLGLLAVPVGAADDARPALRASEALPPAGPQAAAHASAAPTFAEAVEMAWQRATASAEAAGQLQRAQAQRAAAASPWSAPPALEVGAWRDRQRGAGSSRETEVGVALPLWWPGQRAARQGQVTAEVDAAQAHALAARWRLAGQVADAAAEVQLQQAALATAQAQLAEMDAVARDVDRRVAAGDLARADALAAQAERLAAAAAMAQARLGQHAAHLRWQALTGATGVPALPEAVPAAATASGLPPAHPALDDAAAQVAAARQRVAVAQRSRREAPELLVRGREELASGEPATRGVGVALRIPFGTAGHADPLMATALTELALAEAAERALRQQLEADLATARQAEAAARQQRDDETERSRLLRERATLIQTSFQAGETALPDLLRALNAATQAEAAVARARATLAQAVLRLRHTLGWLP